MPTSCSASSCSIGGGRPISRIDRDNAGSVRSADMAANGQVVGRSLTSHGHFDRSNFLLQGHTFVNALTVPVDALARRLAARRRERCQMVRAPWPARRIIRGLSLPRQADQTGSRGGYLLDTRGGYLLADRGGRLCAVKRAPKRRPNIISIVLLLASRTGR